MLVYISLLYLLKPYVNSTDTWLQVGCGFVQILLFTSVLLVLNARTKSEAVLLGVMIVVSTAIFIIGLCGGIIYEILNGRYAVEVGALDHYYLDSELGILPVGYIEGSTPNGDVIIHVATGVQLPKRALWFSRGRDPVVLYHFTDNSPFWTIVRSGRLFASTNLEDDCDFGCATYATKLAPDKFLVLDDILKNNYPRATKTKDK